LELFFFRFADEQRKKNHFDFSTFRFEIKTIEFEKSSFKAEGKKMKF
jgi:hypothetical protein